MRRQQKQRAAYLNNKLPSTRRYACGRFLDHKGGENPNLTWLFRRSYQFMRCEKFFHKKTPWDMLNGVAVMYFWMIALVFPNLR